MKGRGGGGGGGFALVCWLAERAFVKKKKNLPLTEGMIHSRETEGRGERERGRERKTRNRKREKRQR